MNNGFIKLYRKMVDWEWYTDIPVRILFEHCLLMANYKEKKWQGLTIAAGSFITSYEKLALQTGLTIQQIRTAINKLKSTDEITHQTTSSFSIITIKNWVDYQDDNTQINKQSTNNQQTINKQSTTTKKDKNDKKDKNVEINGYINAQKTKKDPFQNSYISNFKNECEKILGNKPYLLNQERNKLLELATEIDDFEATIPIVLAKLKDIDFGFDNWKPNVNWLLKDSNYTSVLNGTYDKQKTQSIIERLREKERMNSG